MDNDPRPFAGKQLCQVVLPNGEDDPFSEVESLRRLVIAESAELTAELGCPVEFATAAHLPGADCTFLIGPGNLNPSISNTGFEPAVEPTVRVDRHRSIVVVDGPTVSDTSDAFQLLRTAIRSGQPVTTADRPESTSEVLDVLSSEIWNTYPAFALRDLDWPEIFSRHQDPIREADASLPSLQRLFAELQDAHTWVKDKSFSGRLPYRAWIEPDGAWFTHIPTWSAAWAAGVRAGDRVLDCDRLDWWDRTSATPRTRALTTGYRWLSGEAGSTRTLRAQTPAGDVIEWDEGIKAGFAHAPLDWRILPSGTGYLRTRAWFHSRERVTSLDNAFRELSACPRLLVDLRGNSGGNLIAAQGFRDRFLREETMLGHIRLSIGGGMLGDPAPIIGTPPQPAQRWHKPVRFLTDRQTYSASEDAILGLDGLPHVQIVGEPSGGGSGRPRTIHLRDGMFATISTALTYDRNGHCVEAHGVPVDIELPLDEHHRDPRRVPASEILRLADAHWN
jgi:carboxyl-terminal processing protease